VLDDDVAGVAGDRHRIELTQATHSMRSLMFVATSTPWLRSCTECPEHPTRCSAREDPLGRAHHHHGVDVPDIDAEFEAGGADYRVQLPVIEPVLNPLADVAI